MLGGNMRKTMVAWQLLLGRIRSGALVEVHRHGRRIGVGEIQIAPGAADQRNQQAERQQQHERQSAKSTSGSCSRYDHANLHHRSTSEPLVRRFQDPVYQTTRAGARAQGEERSVSWALTRPRDN